MIRIMNPNLDHNSGKTCFGGGIHCPSASSFPILYVVYLLMGNVVIINSERSADADTILSL